MVCFLDRLAILKLFDQRLIDTAVLTCSMAMVATIGGSENSEPRPNRHAIETTKRETLCC